MNFRDFLPTQDPDESIYVFVRPYFLTFLPSLSLGFGLVVLGVIMIVLTVFNFPDLFATALGNNTLVILSTAYFLTLIPFFTVIFLDYYYDIHIVTDHRVVDIDQNGLFNREINELALEDVQDVTSFNKGVLSSVYDFGDVTIETAGAHPHFEFVGVRHPREIAGIILDLSEQFRQKSDPHVPAAPHSNIKGVINNQVYTDTDSMAHLGLIGPEAKEDVHKITHDETDSEPSSGNQSEPKQSTESPPPTHSPASDDLDITIDEPSKPPK